MTAKGGEHAPIDHADPHRLLISGTGLTHTGSMQSRDDMHTTKEHAELKRDQIHAFGKDVLIPRCAGSMSASIEPEC